MVEYRAYREMIVVDGGKKNGKGGEVLYGYGAFVFQYIIESGAPPQTSNNSNRGGDDGGVFFSRRGLA